MLITLIPDGASAKVGLISDQDVVIAMDVQVVKGQGSIRSHGKIYKPYYFAIRSFYAFWDSNNLGTFSWRRLGGGIGSLTDPFHHSTDVLEPASQQQIFSIGSRPLTAQ